MDMTERLPATKETVTTLAAWPIPPLPNSREAGRNFTRPQQLVGFRPHDAGRSNPANIWVTRTTHANSAPCHHAVACHADRYVFTIALGVASAGLSDDQGIIVPGPIAAGTVCVTGPAQPVLVTFAGPGDLLHLSVPKSLLEQQFTSAGVGPSRCGLDRLIIQDPLIGQIARVVGDRSASWGSAQLEALGRMIVARLLQALPRRESRTPLPLWRLRKVEALIERDIAAPLRLRDLAAAAGLSRMHFAAQFRAATGLRPHEYVLTRRIERAKSLIVGNELSLVEVALEAGFQSQAHFCTIFKRMTGTTPTCWRQQRRLPVTENSAPRGDRRRCAPGFGSGMRSEFRAQFHPDQPAAAR